MVSSGLRGSCVISKFPASSKFVMQLQLGSIGVGPEIMVVFIGVKCEKVTEFGLRGHFLGLKWAV
jgi:hypothetical protein